MVEVPLTQGKVALIDDEDAAEILRHTWCAKLSGDGVHWYAATKLSGRHVYMHHMLLRWSRGDSRIADHRNGDGLDNRRANLRLCTQQQNVWNKKKNRRGRNPYKGAHQDVRNGRWYARITKDGIRRALGRFATPEEAALAYDKAARRHFGEFACLNFPTDARKEVTPCTPA